MDIDFMNLSPDSQTDLMNMMMQQMEYHDPTTTTQTSNFPITPFAFHQISSSTSSNPTTSLEYHNQSVQAMREMIFRMAAMQPIHIDPESIKPPIRRNVKILKDPQRVAARHRRKRIRILQRLVPGGTKMDTASMLDEAIHYVKFLRGQVQTLQRAAVHNRGAGNGALGYDGDGYLGACYNNNNNNNNC